MYTFGTNSEGKMKKLLICAALVAANANAADANYCSQVGSVYQNAAQMRDLGNPPEMALDMTRSYQRVSEKEKKAAINRVYFDPAFTNAGGTALQMQVMRACMGQGQYQPLK
jgi:hypothetical protein